MSNQKIRFATTADAAELVQIYAPYVTDTGVTFEYEVPSVEEFARRIEEFGSKYPYLVCQRAGELIGYAYAHEFRTRAAFGWDAEVSVYVRRDCIGQGIGSALYRPLLEMVKMQGVKTAYAAISLPNEASVAFHEAWGFRFVGKFERTGFKRGVWHDLVWYELVFGEREGEPAPVRAIGEIDVQSLIN